MDGVLWENLKDQTELWEPVKSLLRTFLEKYLKEKWQSSTPKSHYEARYWIGDARDAR